MNRLSIMDPEDVAPLAIDGLLRRKKVIVPGLLNRWFLFMDKILPGFLKKLIISKTTSKINPRLGYNIYYNALRPSLVKAR